MSTTNSAGEQEDDPFKSLQVEMRVSEERLKALNDRLQKRNGVSGESHDGFSSTGQTNDHALSRGMRTSEQQGEEDQDASLQHQHFKITDSSRSSDGSLQRAMMFATSSSQGGSMQSANTPGNMISTSAQKAARAKASRKPSNPNRKSQANHEAILSAQNAVDDTLSNSTTALFPSSAAGLLATKKAKLADGSSRPRSKSPPKRSGPRNRKGSADKGSVSGSTKASKSAAARKKKESSDSRMGNGTPASPDVRLQQQGPGSPPPLAVPVAMATQPTSVGSGRSKGSTAGSRSGNKRSPSSLQGNAQQQGRGSNSSKSGGGRKSTEAAQSPMFVVAGTPGGSTTPLPERELKLQMELSSARIEKQELEKIVLKLQGERSMFQATVLTMVMEQAKRENASARERHLHNIQRLGWACAVRTGLQQVHESWADGSAFKSIQTRLKAVDKRRTVLEEQKKKLAKMKPKKTDKDDTRKSSRLSEVEYHEKSEVLQLNLLAIKAESEAIKTELSTLVRERNLHVREMKRIADEDNARYKNLPIRLKDRYVLMSLLGKGGFSEVYKAFDLDCCRYVACKVHQLNPHWPDIKKENYIKHATREYDIHKNLHNPHIVELYDVFEIDANSFCTVLEFCPGQDLDFLLKQETKLSERDARSKIMQIMAALEYLNSVNPPVIHYDLKPANVLLHHGEVKLTDFGLSKQMKDLDAGGNMELTSQGAGTYWYLPPECFVVSSEPPKISSKVDVWSVGVIFYQCLYGKKPFGNQESQQAFLRNNTIESAVRLSFPDKPKVSDDAKAFIRSCLTYEASLRPTVMDLKNHRYLLPKKPTSSSSSSSTSASSGTVYSQASTAATSDSTSISSALTAGLRAGLDFQRY